MKKVLFILSSVLFLVGCEKQSELVTIMQIDNVNWQHEYIPSGTALHFIINAESQSSVIQRITLTSSDMELQDLMILDSMLTMPLKTPQISFYYTLPDYRDTAVVLFKACSYDQAGRAASYPITINVMPGAEPLRPIDAITLYSALSGGKSAFSLNTMQTEYLGSDSTAVSWFDFADETDDSKALSCTWHSEVGIKFSRAEGFNYAEATAQSIANTWKNLTSTTTIKQIKADDVILFGKAEQAIGALKIIAVYDEEGTANDRYVFSLKVVKK